jgi:hypothetical protein
LRKPQFSSVRTGGAVKPEPAITQNPPEVGHTTEPLSTLVPDVVAVPSNQDPKNLSRCLNGYYPCNRSLLSPDEVAQVDSLETKRNLGRCVAGYLPCSRTC